MATDLIDIRAAIVSKLETIDALNGVYNFEPAKPDDGKYPFTSVIWLGGEGEFGDTIRNVRIHNFAIRLYQERTKAAFGNQKAETVLLTLADTIFTAFDADTRLGGTVKWVKPLNTNVDYVEREVGDARIAEFILACTTVVPSIT